MRLPNWLAPNRIAVYVGALITILTGVAALLSAIDTPEAVTLGAAVLGLVALLNRFLVGWQSWEREVVAPVARSQLVAEPAGPARTLPIVEPLDAVADESDVPGDDALGFADPHDGWAPGDLDETREAAQQVHLPDAGMPTAADVPDVSVER